MGSRGSFLGTSNIFVTGGKEFKTVLRIGNMRVIEPINSKHSRKLPTLSRTRNAVYATLRPDGYPKQIAVYNKRREKLYEIDLDHDHSQGHNYPNGHVHYYKNGKRQNDYNQPNDKQLELIHQFIDGMAEADYEFKR